MRKPGWDYPTVIKLQPPTERARRRYSLLLAFVFGCLSTLAALAMLGVLP